MVGLTCMYIVKKRELLVVDSSMLVSVEHFGVELEPPGLERMWKLEPT
jgi:hypothetical protein